MNIAKRVGALEGNSPPKTWDKYHSLIFREGQTEDEAIDDYGRDRIGPNDFLTIHKLVSPRFDAEDNMISFKDWPENRASAGFSANA